MKINSLILCLIVLAAGTYLLPKVNQDRMRVEGGSDEVGGFK